MRSRVFTKFVFIYDLTGKKMEHASYMLSARLCEGNAHVVTRTVQAYQLNMYMYHTFNLCACMNAC